MQSFEYKGYNNEFVFNMANVINEISDKSIFLVSDLDDICLKCPLNVKQCETQEKVLKMDQKVLEYFNLKQGIYCYEELKNRIKENITREIFNDICSECEWIDKVDCYSKIKRNHQK